MYELLEAQFGQVWELKISQWGLPRRCPHFSEFYLQEPCQAFTENIREKSPIASNVWVGGEWESSSFGKHQSFLFSTRLSLKGKCSASAYPTSKKVKAQFQPTLAFLFHLSREDTCKVTAQGYRLTKRLSPNYRTGQCCPSHNLTTTSILYINRGAHLKMFTSQALLKKCLDVANVAKVFGPRIVAHAVHHPGPVTMLQDIKHQPKVIEHLLSLPLDSYMSLKTQMPFQHHGHQMLKWVYWDLCSLLNISFSRLLHLVPCRREPIPPSPRTLPRGSKSKSATNLWRQGNFFCFSNAQVKSQLPLTSQQWLTIRKDIPVLSALQPPILITTVVSRET